MPDWWPSPQRQHRHSRLGEVQQRHARDADRAAAGRQVLRGLGRRLQRHRPDVHGPDGREQVGPGQLQQVTSRFAGSRIRFAGSLVRGFAGHRGSANIGDDLTLAPRSMEGRHLHQVPAFSLCARLRDRFAPRGFRGSRVRRVCGVIRPHRVGRRSNPGAP